MSKTVVIGFGLASIVLTYLVSHMPDSILPFIISPSEEWSGLRLGVSVLLIAYMLFTALRRRSVQIGMRLIGIALLAIAVLGVASPESFGLSSLYILPIDLIVLLEGGILALLLSLELPLHESAYRSNRAFDANFYHSWLQAATEPSAMPNRLNPAV